MQCSESKWQQVRPAEAAQAHANQAAVTCCTSYHIDMAILQGPFNQYHRHGPRPGHSFADLWCRLQASPDGNLVAWARNACTAVITDGRLRKDICTIAVHSQQDKEQTRATAKQMRIAEVRWSCNGDLIALLQRPSKPAMDQYAVVSIHATSSGRLLHSEW